MKGKLFTQLFILFIYIAGNAQSTGIPAIGRSNRSGNDNHASGHTNCSGVASMPQGDFSTSLGNVKSQGFDDSKLTAAKQIAESNCLTTGQIAEICKAFGFEETKLRFAEYAYDHCTEPHNYFKLNSVFGFSSNVDELNKYVQSKQ